MTMVTTNNANNPALYGQDNLEFEKLNPHDGMQRRDTKLTAIEYPGMHDVLSGRGGHAMAHSGNLKFRTIIDSYKPRFHQAEKQERMDIANGILAIWRGLNPMGRFLTKTEPLKDDSLWEDIGNKAALKKISQALRERRSYPMVPSGSNTTATQPMGFLDRLQQSPMVPAYVTPAQQQDQIGKIREIEEEIERLKRQNLEQQKLQQQLLGGYQQSQYQPSLAQPMPPQQSQPIAPPPPPPPAPTDEPEPMDTDPSPQQDPYALYNPGPTTYSEAVRQPSYSQAANTGFPMRSVSNSSSTRPPLPRRSQLKQKDKTNSIVRAFDIILNSSSHEQRQEKGSSGDDQKGSGSSGSSTSDGQKFSGSDETMVGRSSLMNESVGSFSASSAASPSMDSANRRHMRLNSSSDHN